MNTFGLDCILDLIVFLSHLPNVFRAWHKRHGLQRGAECKAEIAALEEQNETGNVTVYTGNR